MFRNYALLFIAIVANREALPKTRILTRKCILDQLNACVEVIGDIVLVLKTHRISNVFNVQFNFVRTQELQELGESISSDSNGFDITFFRQLGMKNPNRIQPSPSTVFVSKSQPTFLYMGDVPNNDSRVRDDQQ